MKEKLLGEAAVQFDRLQQQQKRRPVPASSASRLPLSPPLPQASGCPSAHLRLAFPSLRAEGGVGQALPSILGPVSFRPWAAAPPGDVTAQIVQDSWCG